MTWRYGSQQMRAIWSEVHKRRLMRQVWLAIATAQHQARLVSPEQLADLRQHVADVDIERSTAIEHELRHDVMAEIRAYAEQCPIGGAILHWGATSADITDNVDILRLREGLRLLIEQLRRLLLHFVDRIEATASLPVMGFTHIQPAEPTTLGYRLAAYAQDLLYDLLELQNLTATIRGKGLKGAVGTQASFAEIVAGSGMSALELEAIAMGELDLPYFPVATQTYTRRQDLHVQQTLAGLAATLHKFALDARILQSPAIGEWAEPFGESQVGSSAMPFKRNPVNAENICSLARYVASLTQVAWDNASQAILERSLDDSANRRLYQAESFLAMDELLRRSNRLLAGMRFDEAAIQRNLQRFGAFAATERVLMALVAAGADRQEAHEWIRQCSLIAWEQVQTGAANPLPGLLAGHEEIGRYLAPDRMIELNAVEGYLGTAPERALEMAGRIRETIGAEGAVAGS
jgi:adenylosuccinate lyase